MKKFMSLVVALMIVFTIAGCGAGNSTQKPSDYDEKTIEAEITHAENGVYWVDIDGEDVKVPITHMSADREPEVGDTIKIVYTGEISPDKPSIIEDILKIDLVENTGTITAELWGFQEGDPARLILDQNREEAIVLENNWATPNVSHIFSILPQLEWAPCDQPKLCHGATVTLETESFKLIACEESRVVKKIEGDTISCLEAEQTGDAASAPYELLRSWFDELELAQLSAREIVIPDRGQLWQEAAQDFTDAYYRRRTETTSNSQFRWTFVTTEITAMDSEAAQMLEDNGYIGQNSFPFFLQVIFVPETQRALENAIARNYTGDDPKIPAGALEWNLCATVEKQADGWHGEIRGTGW